MTFNADKIKQITEMKRKIQLLEDEGNAFQENYLSISKKNEEEIRHLTEQNKRLHRQLAEAKAGEEKVFKEAFHNRGMDKEALMSGEEDLAKLEQSVLGKKKRLNALKQTTKNLQQRLDELKMEYQWKELEGSNGAQSADARTRREEEDAMKIRALQNRLEKTQFKCKVAKNIGIYYQKLKSHMQEESLTFQGRIDSLEAEILKQREFLHKAQAMNNAAQLAKEAAEAELQQQEELFIKEREERARILASYRKRVEECKSRAEEAVRRAQRTAEMQPDELSSEAQRSSPRMAGEEEKAISTFEEAFRRIKEATGLTDVQEIVQRFISQKETYQHLDKLRSENEKVLQQLREQKELLNQQLQDMKHSGEAKRSRDQQTLEELEQQLQATQQKCDAAKERLDGLVKTFNTVRAGVEHLADKLQHITLTDYAAAEVSPDSDDFVLELLKQCELKLQRLHEEVQGKDLAAIMKEIEDDEFYAKLEGKLPSYNTRVKLTEDDTLDEFNEEAESEEDDADIITREELKRQSQLIVDANSKKGKI